MKYILFILLCLLKSNQILFAKLGFMLLEGVPEKITLWLGLSFKMHILTRLTVGTRQAQARGAIMIPYKAWTWNPLRLRGACN